MLRESSFNMTRGDEDIEGDSEICILQNQQEGEGLLKNEPLARGAAKISSSEFQYLHPLVILNELSLNMCQISSLVAAAEGPVAEFSSFAHFEERKRKLNFLISFPKIVHQKGSFGQIRKNPLFPFCRPILDIFGLTLLSKISLFSV